MKMQEIMLQPKGNNYKHGHSMNNTAEYRTWCKIKERCCNVKDKSYHKYGGMGITVCDRWINSFENFYADMSDKPSMNHSIDRYPNKNGGYSKDNCRWATPEEQANNKNNNILLNLNGETKTLAMWAKEKNIGRDTIYNRINIWGWSIEKALCTPVRKCLEFNGKYKTITEWAKETKIPLKIISQRLKQGMSASKALTLNKEYYINKSQEVAA